MLLLYYAMLCYYYTILCYYYTMLSSINGYLEMIKNIKQQ